VSGAARRLGRLEDAAMARAAERLSRLLGSPVAPPSRAEFARFARARRRHPPRRVDGALDWRPTIEAYARECGLDPDEVAEAVAEAERILARLRDAE
jgi:hypothetical protein